MKKGYLWTVWGEGEFCILESFPREVAIVLVQILGQSCRAAGLLGFSLLWSALTLSQSNTPVWYLHTPLGSTSASLPGAMHVSLWNLAHWRVLLPHTSFHSEWKGFWSMRTGVYQHLSSSNQRIWLPEK